MVWARMAAVHAVAGDGIRRLPPLALLAALTASACCPLLTAGAGALTLAGAGVISAMGTGVLSGLLTSAVDRAREHGSRPSPGCWSGTRARRAARVPRIEGPDQIVCTSSGTSQVKLDRWRSEARSGEFIKAREAARLPDDAGGFRVCGEVVTWA
jgi:hypothetical protein